MSDEQSAAMSRRYPHVEATFNDIVRGDKTYSYTCGYCGKAVLGTIVGYLPRTYTKWLLCSWCAHGSVETRSSINPKPLPVLQIAGLPDDIRQAYNDARKSFMLEIYTGCEMLCRKILMHIAVEKKAAEGQAFASYVTYLKDSGYINEPMKDLADIVRAKGNESNHEIKEPDERRAKMVLEFTSHILRSVYEAAELAKKYKNNTP